MKKIVIFHRFCLPEANPKCFTRKKQVQPLLFDFLRRDHLASPALSQPGDPVIPGDTRWDPVTDATDATDDAWEMTRNGYN